MYCVWQNVKLLFFTSLIMLAARTKEIEHSNIYIIYHHSQFCLYIFNEVCIRIRIFKFSLEEDCDGETDIHLVYTISPNFAR